MQLLVLCVQARADVRPYAAQQLQELGGHSTTFSALQKVNMKMNTETTSEELRVMIVEKISLTSGALVFVNPSQTPGMFCYKGWDWGMPKI